MKHIEINLWKTCNHKCIFCMSWLTRFQVKWFEPKSQIIQELKTLSAAWYCSLGFLWWEPTLHPDFVEIVTIAKDFWFTNIEVISNGSKLHDSNFLNKIIAAGITRISISLHSHDPKVETFFTGWATSAWKEKINAIALVNKAYHKWLLNSEISINTVICQTNYKDLPKLSFLLHKLWVHSQRFNFIQLEWYSQTNIQEVALTYSDFKPYLKKLLLFWNRIGVRMNFEAIPWCVSGLNYMDYSKHSESIVDQIKDNISTDDIDFISRKVTHQKTKRLLLKQYFSKCEHCFLKNDCEWIWKRYTDYFWDKEFQ